MQEQMKVIKEKMNKSIDALNNEYSAIRAGRANPAILDKITVDYYGAPTPIGPMAAISVADARVLVIQPWDASTLKNIEKAINTSDIGINPTNDGKVIRLAFPQPTEERRKELTKQSAKMCEEAKVAIRNIRRDANDKVKEMKKNGELTEDDVKASDKTIQDLTDKFIKLVDGIGAEKNKEIMAI